MKKVLLVIAAILVGIVVVVIAGRNIIIKKGARAAIQHVTGFDLEIDKVKTSLLRAKFGLQDLELINPEEFPERTAVVVHRAAVNYDPFSLLSDNVHFEEISLDVPKVVMVKKADGESNFDRLRSSTEKAKPKKQEPAPQEQPEPRAETGSQTPEKKKAVRQFKIDQLALKVGVFEVHDYSGGGNEPEIKVYRVNREFKYKDVVSVQQLAGLVLTDYFAQHAQKFVDQLSDNIKSLEQSGSGTRSGEEQAEEVGESLNRAAKSLEKSFKGFLKNAKGEE